MRRLTRPLLTAAPGASALAVGLHRDGQRAFVLRGTTAHGGGVPVGAATRFEVGSVTKTFTALLLAEQAGRGELAWHTPLAALLPPGTRMPRRGDAITLTQLATHTAGLPRLPPGLLGSIGTRWFSNPYAAFGAEDVLAALARTRVRSRPGSRVRYSNFGVGLLGYALSGAAGGTPYGALLAERVLDPLRLRDTTACATPPAGTTQVTGHWHGRPRPPFHIPGLPAAGAVRSSVRDLLTVTEALMGPYPDMDPNPNPGPNPYLDLDLDLATDPDTADAPVPPPAVLRSALRSALREVTVPRLVRPHGQGQLALVWNIRPRPDGSRLYHHSGGTRGCTAFIAFNPERRTALVALANTAPSWDNRLIQRAYEAVLHLAGSG
ncbi:serine hydrolase domain-containing protein [Streptomyces odontomachi]|uniref:serine hydrolase domain-containing protein n=1 Tax=Streptomyces odontomachi TaxID=2944940 RepID=UPI002109BB2F|nr:serine hydrolase domain-containing protein [Streptomyces sp. ODS25]